MAKARSREKARKPGVLTTVSHLVMAGVMITFFCGAGLGAYATIRLGEPVSTTLNYIMKLAFMVGWKAKLSSRKFWATLAEAMLDKGRKE